MADAPTFDNRFETLAALAYRVAFRLVGDRHVAEELAQETLARAFQRWRRIASYDEAWTVRVTTNLVIGRWRRPRQIAEVRNGQPADAGLAERLDLIRAILDLPRRQREVVTLRYLGDLSEADVASALGCSRGSVKQHAHRGLAALRTSLRHLGPPAREPKSIQAPAEETPCV